MGRIVFDNTDGQFEDNDYTEEFNFQEYVENPMKEILAKRDIVMRCQLGLWDGTHEGGAILTSMDDFWRIFKDCDTCKVEQTEEGLKIEVNHHDGANYYMLRTLTDAGWDYSRENEDILEPRQLHENLWHEMFSSPIDLLQES